MNTMCYISRKLTESQHITKALSWSDQKLSKQSINSRKQHNNEQKALSSDKTIKNHDKIVSLR